MNAPVVVVKTVVAVAAVAAVAAVVGVVTRSPRTQTRQRGMESWMTYPVSHWAQQLSSGLADGATHYDGNLARLWFPQQHFKP